MQTFRLVTPLLFFVALVATAFGQSAPEGFRDLKWGATIEEASRVFPSAVCGQTTGDVLADWKCTLRYEVINNSDVRVFLSGYDTGDTLGLSTFSLSFKPGDVQRIVEAFESRYGPAHQVEQREFLAQGGGRSPNSEWHWIFPKVTIDISQRAGRVGDAIAIVSLRSALKEFQARREEQKREAGKGL